MIIWRIVKQDWIGFVKYRFVKPTWIVFVNQSIKLARKTRL